MLNLNFQLLKEMFSSHHTAKYLLCLAIMLLPQYSLICKPMKQKCVLLKLVMFPFHVCVKVYSVIGHTKYTVQWHQVTKV